MTRTNALFAAVALVALILTAPVARAESDITLEGKSWLYVKGTGSAIIEGFGWLYIQGYGSVTLANGGVYKLPGKRPVDVPAGGKFEITGKGWIRVTPRGHEVRVDTSYGYIYGWGKGTITLKGSGDFTVWKKH